MTQPAPSPDHPVPETFFGVVLRRSRYALAIVFSAFLFSTLAWQVAAPPPEHGGVSLVIWGGTGQGLVAGLMLALLLVVSAAVCTLLVHPDNPHMGLFCALLGACALSVRGGTVYDIVRLAQASPEKYGAAARMLGLECLQWGVICVVAAIAVELIHRRFFKNYHWVMRSGGDLPRESLHKARPGESVMGVAHTASSAAQTGKLPLAVATPLAAVLCGVIGFCLLYLLLQSQAKGQVFLACFAAFYGAGALTYIVFPKAPVVAFIAAVPLTAAVGCFYASGEAGWPAGNPGFFPGQAHFFMMRALPLDYIAAGVPGVLLGYYHGFWWSLHSHEE